MAVHNFTTVYTAGVDSYSKSLHQDMFAGQLNLIHHHGKFSMTLSSLILQHVYGYSVARNLIVNQVLQLIILKANGRTLKQLVINVCHQLQVPSNKK